MRNNIFLIFFVSLIITNPVNAVVYMQDDFGNYDDKDNLNSSNWYASSSVSLEESGCRNNKCVMTTYTSAGYSNYAFNYSINLQEMYVGFWAKVVNHTISWPKFFKIFGELNPEGYYANMTLMRGDYVNAHLYSFEHGNGAVIGDSQCAADFQTGSSNCSGTWNYYAGKDFQFTDSNWHHFVVHWKYNDNSVANGEFGLWIDDELYASVSGITNRNDSNSLLTRWVSFGDYTSTASASPLYIYWDNVIIASTYAEVVQDSLNDIIPPSAPTELKVE